MRVRRFAQFLQTVGTVEPINISLLRPSVHSIRTKLGDTESLRNSIKTHGLLEPILVRPSNGSFEVIAGHRRLQACKELGWQEIPCIVRSLEDKQAFEAALIENIQRETLNPIEEAESYKRYVLEYGYGSISELASRIGKSEEYVSHRILMLNLPVDVLEKVSRHQLSPSAAQELVWLRNVEQRKVVAIELEKYKLPVSQIREALRLVKNGFDADEAFSEVARKREESKTLARKSASDLRTLEHAILVLRMAMTRLDSLIEDAKSNSLKNFLIEQRFAVHQLTDNCIKMKTKIVHEKQQDRIHRSIR
jgi:ParB family chromosome partitioning protein